MARYQVILVYDGSGFRGSQRQARSRTVQGELERSLRRLGWGGKSVLMAGRTDTGVHARGQVAAFDLEWKYAAAQLQKALNAELPADLSIFELREAERDFHPRFHAVSRVYCYRLFCGPLRDPLRERYSWRVWPEIDGSVLTSVSGVFLGRHDFSAFGSPTSTTGTTVRTICQAQWMPLKGGEWQFNVKADAFLYRMVRRLVFVQVSVAQGKFPADGIQAALEKGSRLPAGLAPAHGLTLEKVNYGSD